MDERIKFDNKTVNKLVFRKIYANIMIIYLVVSKFNIISIIRKCCLPFLTSTLVINLTFASTLSIFQIKRKKKKIIESKFRFKEFGFLFYNK